MATDSKAEMQEVSLQDIFNVLRKNKRLFCWVFLTIIAIGLAVTLVKPATYEYSQVIRVASYGFDTNVKSNAQVATEINSIILPGVRNQEIQSSLVNTVKVTTKLKNQPVAGLDKDKNDNADYILLQARGPLNQGPVYQDLFSKILTQLNAYDQPQFDLQKTIFQNQLELSKEKVTKLQKMLDVMMDSPDFTQGVRSDSVPSSLVVSSLTANALSGINNLFALQSQVQDLTINLSNMKQNVFASSMSAKRSGLHGMQLFWLFVVFGFVLGLIAVFLRVFFQTYFWE